MIEKLELSVRQRHGLPVKPGGRIDPGNIHWPMLTVASNAKRPPMRRAGRRGRPPQLLGMWPLADGATLSASHPDAANAGPRPCLIPSAAAGYPPEGRGPRSPGTGDDRRASGST